MAFYSKPGFQPQSQTSQFSNSHPYLQSSSQLTKTVSTLNTKVFQSLQSLQTKNAAISVTPNRGKDSARLADGRNHSPSMGKIPAKLGPNFSPLSLEMIMKLNNYRNSCRQMPIFDYSNLRATIADRCSPNNKNVIHKQTVSYLRATVDIHQKFDKTVENARDSKQDWMKHLNQATQSKKKETPNFSSIYSNKPKAVNSANTLHPNEKINDPQTKSSPIIQIERISVPEQKDNKSKRTKDSIKTTNRVIEGWQIGGVLGSGRFGQVYLCKHLETGYIAAIKILLKAKVKQYKMESQLLQEIKLHQSLNHPHVVKFYCFFSTKDEICIVMEYLNGGTLFEKLNQKQKLPLAQAVDFSAQIIKALHYLHDRSIAHRDIKPENIVISMDKIVKLCDFGWSAIINAPRKTYCGTLEYSSPEMVERKLYNASIDIWCIGVLMYELLTGTTPFEGQREDVMHKIVNFQKLKNVYLQSAPKEARHFIQECLQKNPQLRPKASKLLEFDLFQATSEMKSPEKQDPNILK